MTEASPLVHGAMTWQRSSGWIRPGYRLAREDQDLATLTLRRGIGTPADLEVGGQRWRLRKRGFRTRVEVRIADADLPLTEYQSSWGGGTLSIPGAETVVWTNPWFRRAGRFEDTDGVVIYEFKPSLALRRCTVTPGPASLRTDNLGLLLGLGWYLIVLRQRQAAAAGS